MISLEFNWLFKRESKLKTVLRFTLSWLLSYYIVFTSISELVCMHITVTVLLSCSTNFFPFKKILKSQSTCCCSSVTTTKATLISTNLWNSKSKNNISSQWHFSHAGAIPVAWRHAWVESHLLWTSVYHQTVGIRVLSTCKYIIYSYLTFNSFIATLKACSGRSADLEIK